MTNSLNSSWGAFTLPLSETGDSDFAALDPARDILLDLFEAAINFELEPVWAIAASGSGLTQPVSSKLPALDDLDTMRQRGATFPMLSVCRSGDPQNEDEFTLWQDRITSKWTIDYVLGPLEIGDQIKLGDVLTAVAKIIATTIQNGGHKAYATTAGPNSTETAKQVLGPGTGLCGFSTIAITSFIQGSAAFAQGGPKYHALTMTLQTTELDSIADEGVAYAGAGATVGSTSEVARTDADIGFDTAIAVQLG